MGRPVAAALADLDQELIHAGLQVGFDHVLAYGQRSGRVVLVDDVLIEPDLDAVVRADLELHPAGRGASDRVAQVDDRLVGGADVALDVDDAVGRLALAPGVQVAAIEEYRSPRRRLGAEGGREALHGLQGSAALQGGRQGAAQHTVSQAQRVAEAHLSLCRQPLDGGQRRPGLVESCQEVKPVGPLTEGQYLCGDRLLARAGLHGAGPIAHAGIALGGDAAPAESHEPRHHPPPPAVGSHVYRSFLHSG